MTEKCNFQCNGYLHKSEYFKFRRPRVKQFLPLVNHPTTLRNQRFTNITQRNQSEAPRDSLSPIHEYSRTYTSEEPTGRRISRNEFEGMRIACAGGTEQRGATRVTGVGDRRVVVNFLEDPTKQRGRASRARTAS